MYIMDHFCMPQITSAQVSEDVQKEILTISQKLAEEGEIVIMGRGKDEYV